MTKSDHKFVNTGQSYELEGWLDRNEYRKTAANNEELQKIILNLKGGDSSKNLKWEELNNARAKNPSKFTKLEKKK